MDIYSKVVDIHNNSVWSDGDNSVEEIIDNAIKNKIEVIGISDHYEMISDLQQYINTILSLRMMYSDRISILIGCELQIPTFLKLDELKLNYLNNFDYILVVRN